MPAGLSENFRGEFLLTVSSSSGSRFALFCGHITDLCFQWPPSLFHMSSYGLSLIRTFAIVFRPHLDNPGWSHPKALNLSTYVNIIFQIRAHPQVLEVWMWMYLLGSHHSIQYREVGLLGQGKQFLCILYGMKKLLQSFTLENNIVWLRLLNYNCGYTWEVGLKGSRVDQ